MKPWLEKKPGPRFIVGSSRRCSFWSITRQAKQRSFEKQTNRLEILSQFFSFCFRGSFRIFVALLDLATFSSTTTSIYCSKFVSAWPKGLAIAENPLVIVLFIYKLFQFCELLNNLILISIVLLQMLFICLCSFFALILSVSFVRAPILPTSCYQSRISRR